MSMPWQREKAKQVASKMEGAIWWGVAAAVDQWRNNPSQDARPRKRLTDDLLVERLKSHPWTGEQTYAFAREYSVHQGAINTNVDGNRLDKLEEIAQYLFKEYKSVTLSLSGDPSRELARLWVTAVSGVHDIIAKYNRGVGGNLSSFCMKSLWYYQPVHATMWDRYAVMALNDEMGAKHRNGIKEEKAATAFLNDFEVLHARWLPTIESDIAAQTPLLGMTYPYTRRVLDKALWLLGKGLDKKIPKGKIKAASDSQPEDFIAVLEKYDTNLRRATEEKFDLA